MREIRLDGVQYPIDGDIITRPIQPWKPALGITGSRQYSDFSQAEMEEYHDFRNGIGLQSDIEGQTARNWWGEGVDVSTARSAVLGPLVTTAEYDTWEASHAYSLLNFVIPTTPTGYCYECTTAGTSGGTEPSPWKTTVGQTNTGDGEVTWTCRAYLAPIKIIDFKGTDATEKTYVIQNGRILKWDGTNLDCVDNSLANPIDAIVVTDDTDEYLIVSSATTAKYTINGEDWIDIPATRKSPTGFSDPDNSWDTEENAYDDDTDTSARTTMSNVGWSKFLELTVATFAASCVRYFIHSDTNVKFSKVDVDVYYGGAWHDVYEGAFTENEWITKDISTAPQLVSKARFSFYLGESGAGLYAYLAEFDFGFWTPAGYLADYDNRLYWIKTDASIVGYSTAKDIDDCSGNFTLTGNYGTLYDFFEGKLLSDGSPTLYFCGTRGVYSLDTSTELAYKQEIGYPPLTYAGHAGKYWNANLWVATGYGILKITPSMAAQVGPDQGDGLPGDCQGKIYDMVTVGNWLVYCVNGGSSDKSSIIKRNASVGGNLQVYTTSAVSNPIACIHHSPSSATYPNGRLWFGEGANVKYMMFPDITSNVKQLTTYEYVNDSGYFQLPIFRKLAAINKVALGVAAITKSCDDSDYINLYYGLNGAAPTNAVGTGSFVTSPRPTILTFGSGLGLEFYRIQFAYKLIRGGTDTNSPELESLMFYWYPVITALSAWTFRVLCVDDDADATIKAFEDIRDTATLVVFYPSGDEAKTSYNVKLTTMPLRFYHEEMGGREGYIEITVSEVFKG